MKSSQMKYLAFLPFIILLTACDESSICKESRSIRAEVNDVRALLQAKSTDCTKLKPMANSLISRKIWIDQLALSELTWVETRCVGGTTTYTDSDGNVHVKYDPCQTRVIVARHYKQGYNEARDLGHQMSELAQGIFQYCNAIEDRADPVRLEEISSAAVKRIDNQIVNNGISIFITVGCSKDIAFAQLDGRPTGGTCSSN